MSGAFFSLLVAGLAVCRVDLLLDSREGVERYGSAGGWVRFWTVVSCVACLLCSRVVNIFRVLIEFTTPSKICLMITNMKPPMTIAAAMGAPTSVIKPKISMSLFETFLTFRRTRLLE